MVALRLDSLPKILRPHPVKKNLGCPTVYEVRFDWTAGESNHNLCSLFVTCTTVVYGEFDWGPHHFVPRMVKPALAQTHRILVKFDETYKIGSRYAMPYPPSKSRSLWGFMYILQTILLT